MSNNNLQYYIEKLYQIDKELGGKAKQEKTGKKADEFETAKNLSLQNIHEINKKQNERDQKQEKFGRSDQDVIRLGVEIRDKIHEVGRYLSSMETVMKRWSKNPKKYPPSVLEPKLNQYEKIKQLMHEADAREKGELATEYSQHQNAKTITELRAELIANGQRPEYRNELDANELEALNRFAKNDEIIEAKLDEVIVGIEGWNKKAQLMGDKIDERDHKILQVTKEVNKADEQLKTSNKRLKEVIKKFRAPNKLCLDIILICFLLGLVAVIINMMRK